MNKTENFGPKVILASVLLAAAVDARASLTTVDPTDFISWSPSTTVNTTTTVTSQYGALTPYASLASNYDVMKGSKLIADGTLYTTVFKVASGLVFEYTLSVTDTKVGNVTPTGGVSSMNVDFYQAASDAVGFGAGFGGGGMITDDNANQSIDVYFGSTVGAGSNATFFVYSSDPYTQLGGASLLSGPNGGTATVYAALPEPGTIVSGALLVLPLGASGLRILRRKAFSSTDKA